MSSKRSVGTRRSLTFVNTLLVTTSLAVPAFAQIETVVVTAQKREENVQTVPVAISVFSAEKRDAVGIKSIQDMTNFTPGLQYNTSTDRISLRGVGRQTNVLSADASVANYDDGLYETFAVAAGRSSLDLDRVEVLRGPQGTLYGRNAIAGALNEITHRPADDFEGEVRATYSSFDNTDLQGYITGPLNNVWSYRLYADWNQQTRGWAQSIIPGNPGEGNVVNTIYVDGQIQAKFNPHFEMWTKIQGAEWHNGAGGPGGASGGWTPADLPTYEYGVAATALNPGYGCSAAPGGAYNAAAAGGSTTAYDPQSPLPLATACNNPGVKTPWLINRLVPYKVQLPEYWSLNTQWTYHSDADFDIKYIGGGTFYHYILTGPANGGNGTGIDIAPISHYRIMGPFGPFPNGIPGNPFGTGPVSPDPTVSGLESFNYQEKNGFFSNELNFVSTGTSNVQWQAGVYQFQQHYTQPVYTTDPGDPTWNGPFGAPGFFCSAPIANGGNGVGTGGVCANETDFRRFDNRPSVNDTSLASYGQVDWTVIPSLKLTGGIRYSYDRKYGTEQVRLLCDKVPACFAAPEVNNFIPGGVPAVDLTQLGTVVAAGNLTNAAGVTQFDASGNPIPDLPRGVTNQTTYDPIGGFASRTYNAIWSAITGTAGAEWTPDDDTLVYGKYARGYKSGGFNIGIFTVLSFNPYTKAEHVDSFEVGAKHSFGDWLVANVALFHYRYTNLQIPLAVVQTAGGLTQSETSFFNVPVSVSQGAELETQISPFENFNIIANYSYLDAHIQQGIAADPADPNATAAGAKPIYNTNNNPADPNSCVNPVNHTANPLNPNHPVCAPDIYTAGTGPGGVGWNIPQNMAGNVLPNSSRNKVAINFLYNWSISNFGMVQPSVSYVWRSAQYGTLFTRSYNKAPGWDEEDAQLTWTSESGKYALNIYGKNIFNHIGYDSGAYGTRLAGTVDTAGGGAQNFVQGINNPAGYGAIRGEDATGHVSTYSVTPPATYGVELRYKF